jgi:hypothetical protein
MGASERGREREKQWRHKLVYATVSSFSPLSKASLPFPLETLPRVYLLVLYL